MIGLKLKKALLDIWFNKARSCLIVLSIAIGVAGVGLIGQTLNVLQRGMADSLRSLNPSQAGFLLSPYPAALLADISRVPGVTKAEGRLTISARIQPQNKTGAGSENGKWSDMVLTAVPAYESVSADRLFPQEGHWPPAKGELYLEHLTARYLDLQVGDSVRMETPDGNTYEMKVAGTLKDPGKETTTLSGTSYGFVTLDTLPQLGIAPSLNTLTIQADQGADGIRSIEKAADQVREFLGNQGLTVYSTYIPEPGKHWGSAIVNSMGSILQSLGILALLLSATLVTNTVFAIMAGQIRQIGVMKVLGAVPAELARMYYLTIFLYGVLGICIGLPLGMAGVRVLTSNAILLLNFDGNRYGLSPVILGLQAVIGIVVPLVAASAPITKGIRITAREAISGQAETAFGTGRIDRLVEKIRGLPRPFLLSLRNTFRKKGRLTLTLLSLGLGGAIVVSVFSVYASLQLSLANSMKYSKSDISVTLAQPVPKDTLTRLAKETKDVESVETWGLTNAERVRGDGSVSGDFSVAAPSVGTSLIQPQLEDGRWLEANDRNAIVIDKFLLAQEPDLKVGGEITLKLHGKTSTWHIVGIARKLVGDVVNYVKEEDLAAQLGTEGLASQVHIVTKAHDRQSQTAVESGLKSSLKQQGIPISSTSVSTEVKEVQTARIQIVIVFIVMMALLMTLISALGLMGTMSLNVMERTREIGVLRSIGADNRSIWGMIIAETMVIGGIGWLIGFLLAVPASYLMSLAVGQSLYKSPLDYVFPWSGALYWLLVSMTLSVVSSLIPAWRASSLTVRDAINYE